MTDQCEWRDEYGSHACERPFLVKYSATATAIISDQDREIERLTADVQRAHDLVAEWMEAYGRERRRANSAEARLVEALKGGPVSLGMFYGHTKEQAA